MYGFHKRVGLSDNSMRASENKSKTPSEYSNAYFRRGRPDLLWLIEKPKSAAPPKKKKGRGDGQDSGDEFVKDENDAASVIGGQNEVDRPPQNKLSGLEQEVKALQRSQQQIFAILARMRDENNEYIRQASAMVANHERHENSINAILTFLATFYDRNLQGQAAGGLYANSIPGQQGNVVDVGDLDDQSIEQPTPVQRPTRRPLLLPAPPVEELASESPVPRSSRSNQGPSPKLPEQGSLAQSAQTSPGRTDSPSTASDIMSAINSANANSKY